MYICNTYTIHIYIYYMQCVYVYVYVYTYMRERSYTIYYLLYDTYICITYDYISCIHDIDHILYIQHIYYIDKHIQVSYILYRV